MIRAVLFDLDDTLYDEAEYVASGFRQVAAAIAGRCGARPDDVYAFMQAELARHGRGRIFDAALAAFGLPATAETVAGLVALYRRHVPVLHLHPDAGHVLPVLRADYRLAVVTDGLPAMQRAKLAALGLDGRLDSVVCCWEHGAPKPDPLGYRIALDQLGLDAAVAVVVGDRPDHDMAAARALGCRSVRVQRGRFAGVSAGEYPADREIASLDALPAILAGFEENA